MVLSFVRDLFADAEKLPAFSRVVSHLKNNAGRISVSGLTFSAKALLISQLQKTGGRPLIVVVRNNEAAEEYIPVIQAYCELIGGAASESIVSLPSRDVLPFQNLSPHPEIQEHHVERRRVNERIVPSQEPGDQDQVRRRRDGQELGQALDEPENRRMEHLVHRSAPAIG